MTLSDHHPFPHHRRRIRAICLSRFCARVAAFYNISLRKKPHTIHQSLQPAFIVIRLNTMQVLCQLKLASSQFANSLLINANVRLVTSRQESQMPPNRRNRRTHFVTLRHCLANLLE